MSRTDEDTIECQPISLEDAIRQAKFDAERAYAESYIIRLKQVQNKPDLYPKGFEQALKEILNRVITFEEVK